MSSPYIGQISIFAGNFPPAGWALCNGQTMAIAENDTLFNLIGTTYGGDGQETFNLPNLQSRVPIHMGNASSGTTYVIGEMAGVETVTLSTSQIPQHNHLAMTVSGTPGNLSTPGTTAVLADEQVGLGTNSPFTYTPYNSASPNQVTFASATVANAGGSQPHENIQPMLAVNFIISLYGIYPSPN
jgi:microcystin-dependent protein